ncbi:MAG TPA: site-specific integrase [Blastocatellia bacterium]|nr:site-specific integrase [Blastocatellia bacterium]
MASVALFNAKPNPRLTPIKKLLREIEYHGPQIITGERMTFSELARIYEERKLIAPQYQGDVKIAGLRAYKSYKQRLKTLVAHFGRKSIKHITHSDLEQFKLQRLSQKTWRGDVRSHADVNCDLQLMPIVLNFARKQQWLVKSPFDHGSSLINTAHEKHRDRVLTRDEEARLLLACETKSRQHIRPILIALLDTALRRGKALSLRWSDVDLEAGVIRVRATIAKTAKSRVVPITSRLRVELTRLKSQAPDDPNLSVFGVGDFKKAFAAACRAAGIKGLRVHDLRHTATTRMVEAGMPPAQVMVVTGHSEFSTFRRYVSADYEDAELFQTRECGNDGQTQSLSRDEIEKLPGLVIVIKHVKQ